MGSAWTVGWIARRRSRPKSRPGRASGTLKRHASTGPSPSPPHGRNCGNSTRQMKMDDPLVGITTPVFDRATVLRAKYNFKLGDSLHLAAAIKAGCDRFLTNDRR